MQLTAIVEPDFGVGVYSFPVAAKLLQASPRRLRHWMKTGLTPASYERGEALSDVLSFHDLISLEIVHRMRDLGVSLQKIRILESELRRFHPNALRPFAFQIFWSDGVNVWYELEPGDERLVQGAGPDRRQLAWRGVIRSFAEEIDYRQGAAVRWRPLPHIELNPRVQFGEPVISGTRATVKTIVANLEVGTPEDVARWFDLTVEQVRAAQRVCSGPPINGLSFLLDENLSPRVAQALELCEYRVTHVQFQSELGKGTLDEDIVPWCGRQ